MCRNKSFKKLLFSNTEKHEVGTHILTYCNGLRQPIRQLRVGLAQNDQLQEGLAVFSEYLVGGLNNDRLRLIAARVIGRLHDQMLLFF